MIQKLAVIIDDDIDDVEIMKEVFIQISPSLHCLSFDHPVEAIRELCKEKFPVPDYAFIDLNMPLMSGHECLSELRKIKRFERLPIVMFSTSIPESVAIDLKKKGATFTFEKPYNMNGYKEILKNVITD